MKQHSPLPFSSITQIIFPTPHRAHQAQREYRDHERFWAYSRKEEDEGEGGSEQGDREDGGSWLDSISRGRWS